MYLSKTSVELKATFFITNIVIYILSVLLYIHDSGCFYYGNIMRFPVLFFAFLMICPNGKALQNTACFEGTKSQVLKTGSPPGK